MTHVTLVSYGLIWLGLSACLDRIYSTILSCISKPGGETKVDSWSNLEKIAQVGLRRDDLAVHRFISCSPQSGIPFPSIQVQIKKDVGFRIRDCDILHTVRALVMTCNVCFRFGMLIPGLSCQTPFQPSFSVFESFALRVESQFPTKLRPLFGASSRSGFFLVT